MRNLIWIAAFAMCTQVVPAAYAQSDTGTKAGAYDAGAGTTTPPGFKAGQLDPANCGTPDSPKPCGPVPRRALRTYPGHDGRSG